MTISVPLGAGEPAGDRHGLRRRALLVRRPGRLPAAGPARRTALRCSVRRSSTPPCRRPARSVRSRPTWRARSRARTSRSASSTQTSRTSTSIFRDPNFLGINADTITDPTDEFIISGPGGNVAVNGAAVEVDPTNPFLFRYFLEKIDENEDLFTLGGEPAGPAQHGADRVPPGLVPERGGRWGATNEADFESFYLFRPPAGVGALADDEPAAAGADRDAREPVLRRDAEPALGQLAAVDRRGLPAGQPAAGSSGSAATRSGSPGPGPPTCSSRSARRSPRSR